jgi:hypothetical protein
MPGVGRRSRRISVPHPLLGFGGRDNIKSGVLLASSIAYGGTNEVQAITITGTPTGGTFTLTKDGQTTTNLAYNADRNAVEDALEALSTIGAGNVRVTGGPAPGTPFAVTFVNDLGRRDTSVMTAAHAFTGGTSPAIAVTTTTPGDNTDAQRLIAKRGTILMKGGPSNSKLVPWDGASATTIFGVLAREVELLGQTSEYDADVPVWRGPNCDFNAVVLAQINPVSYAGGGIANFATWAAGRGCTVGSQA